MLLTDFRLIRWAEVDLMFSHYFSYAMEYKMYLHMKGALILVLPVLMSSTHNQVPSDRQTGKLQGLGTYSR